MLIFKRASASRSSGKWNDDDFDVLADGVVVGRIMKVHAAPIGSPWMWTLAFGCGGRVLRSGGPLGGQTGGMVGPMRTSRSNRQLPNYGTYVLFRAGDF